MENILDSYSEGKHLCTMSANGHLGWCLEQQVDMCHSLSRKHGERKEDTSGGDTFGEPLRSC
jgi:hypothetical protein